MRTSTALLWLALGGTILLAGCMPRQRAVITSYLGWTNAVDLDNGAVKLVAVPGISRVVHFSCHEKPNVFYLDATVTGQLQYPDMNQTGLYKDFGGAKLWVAPQSQWKNHWGDWPPHFALDSAACRVEKSAGITLYGPPDRTAGVRFTRSVSLQGSSAEIAVVMTNVTDHPVTWGIWTITCIKPGGKVFLPFSGDEVIRAAEQKQAVAPESCGWRRVGKTLMLEQTKGKDGAKVFSAGDAGWMGAIVERQALFITFAADSVAKIPSGETAAEVYSCANFVELEHVGRLETLRPGTQATLKERWHVFPAPPECLRVEQTAAWMSAKAATLKR